MFTMVSMPRSMKWAKRNSMCRALLPPNAKPVVSSRLMKSWGTASISAFMDSAMAARSRGISSKGCVFTCELDAGEFVDGVEDGLGLHPAPRASPYLAAWLPVPELVGEGEGLGEAAGVDEDYGDFGV